MSDYLNTLLVENPDVGKRYQEKLKAIEDIDPFQLNLEELDSSMDGMPPVSIVDIFEYLVLTHRFYTQEQMKAPKSLQAYKYFEEGFVLNLGTKLINNNYVLLGKVNDFQTENAKPLEAWCIIAKDGSILSGHCTCMTGLDEVCIHVGAILFAVEYATNRKEDAPCADVRSEWNMPASSTQEEFVPVPVNDMDWGEPSQSKIQNTEIEKDDLQSTLELMEKLGHDAAIMRIVEPFASKIAAKRKENLP